MAYLSQFHHKLTVSLDLTQSDMDFCCILEPFLFTRCSNTTPKLWHLYYSQLLCFRLQERHIQWNWQKLNIKYYRSIDNIIFTRSLQDFYISVVTLLEFIHSQFWSGPDDSCAWCLVHSSVEEDYHPVRWLQQPDPRGYDSHLVAKKTEQITYYLDS